MLRIFQEANDKETLPQGAFPVTVDVQSLYTNIPSDGPDGGLQAIEKVLEQRADKSVPTWYLMALLQQVLAGNIFTFDDDLWVQKIGTAMGTMVAPSYACLFMSWLEEERILKNWHGTKPLMFKRFIDDIYFTWCGSVQELEQFIGHMNSQHTHIKFTPTYNIETRTIPFLDMSVTIEGGKIKTDLYK